MTGYTKLFQSILGSTIWRESKEVRLVWITMLALKDRFQVVNASVPGLATFAGVTLEECEAALRVLSSPDEYSRSKVEGGRRIKETDGGWLVINGEKYRDMMNADERREANRIYQKRHREKTDKNAAGKRGRKAPTSNVDEARQQMDLRGGAKAVEPVDS